LNIAEAGKATTKSTCNGDLCFAKSYWECNNIPWTKDTGAGQPGSMDRFLELPYRRTAPTTGA
jgi:hypothetical protein